jgi:S-DNA-T family DNA segregation ATPase FtsK/SpoIIIE
VIGRDAGCDVVLADPLVSKRHARIEVDQGVELVDLNSANGLIVDGGRVQRGPGHPGQVITIGDTEVSFSIVAGTDAAPDPVLERGGRASCSTGHRASRCVPPARSTGIRPCRPRPSRGCSHGP